MINSYIKLAWRNLLKHKDISVINILGLAIGIAACMIIFLYVQSELTYDRYNVKADRIVRVTTTMHFLESDLVSATYLTPLADVLQREYPEVEATVRLEPSLQVVSWSSEHFREEAFYKADQSVFFIFSFDFLEGTIDGALQNPNSIVITKTIAKKYFGAAPALGKTMRCNNKVLQVTGVVKDRPSNSDIRIDALLSANFSQVTSWIDNFSVYTFILFKEKPNLKNFEHKIAEISKKYVQPELNARGASDFKAQFELEPLSEVHFSKGKIGDTPKGDRQFNYIFSLLAVCILIIALLNYINLSTAKATDRAKEVGIRKVSGALHFQLVSQFLFESFLLVAFAWLFAVGLVLFGLPFFNKLLQTNLALGGVHNMLFMGAMFLITLLLAGLYPAFVLSSYKTINVLKGNFRNSVKGVFLRKVVTVIQFAIAAALIMGTAVIYNQIKYIQLKDLGFNKDQLLTVYLPDDSSSRSAVTAFQNGLRRRPEVKDLTVGTRITESGLAQAPTVIETGGQKKELMCNYYQVDAHFLPVFQISLLEGRNFSENYGTDKNEAFLVNEAFVKMTGWKSGVGHKMEGLGRKGKVIGVVKNFYYKSLRNLVEPLALVYNTNLMANTTMIKINRHDLTLVKELHNTYFPSRAFDYAFFDDIVNSFYKRDRLTLTLFNKFTLLAILVSCLGLYGLVALIAVQRSKEISIRKILGASPMQLFFILSKYFIKLVSSALVIALPIAGFIMNKWLSDYAYRITLTWWLFFIPVLLLLIVTMAVVSREIIKTALINPARNLRSE